MSPAAIALVKSVACFASCSGNGVNPQRQNHEPGVQLQVFICWRLQPGQHTQEKALYRPIGEEGPQSNQGAADCQIPTAEGRAYPRCNWSGGLEIGSGHVHAARQDGQEVSRRRITPQTGIITFYSRRLPP
jgi:hypothetical protein